MNVDAARSLTERIYTRLNNRRPDIEKAEQYYEGKQPLAFATDEWKKANAARYAGFSDNWCGPIVNAEAERLKPIGVTNLGSADANKLWSALQFNEFDMQFSQGVITTLAAKRTFVIVWGDKDNEPVVTFEHPSNVEIEYDWENPRLRKAALKTWVDESKEYATLYTPGEVFKWVRDRERVILEQESQVDQARIGAASDGGWVPREVDGESWPVRNPIGVVPVVEIANRPTLRGNPISEIQGVMPMQDAINLLWAYLFLAADYASMDARVILGSEPPRIPILDADGVTVIGTRAVDMKDMREKRLLTLTGADAKIDSWKAAALDIFTDTIEIAVGHVAAQTRTPPHYLVSNKGISNLSGDALTATEIGLTKKADEFVSFTDPQLREVLRLVALVKDMPAAANDVRLAKIEWANREIRSESQMADALLKKKQMGYPLEFLMELDGIDPDTRKRVLGMVVEQERELMMLGVQAAVEDDGGAGVDS